MIHLDTGDTAWVLASTALVLFMTPGLALFYGGMVRSKNVLGTLMHSIFAMGLISILWVLVGYTLAFGLVPTGTSAAELGRIQKVDSETWAPSVRASAFTPEQ